MISADNLFSLLVDLNEWRKKKIKMCKNVEDKLISSNVLEISSCGFEWMTKEKIKMCKKVRRSIDFKWCCENQYLWLWDEVRKENKWWMSKYFCSC